MLRPRDGAVILDSQEQGAALAIRETHDSLDDLSVVD